VTSTVEADDAAPEVEPARRRAGLPGWAMAVVAGLAWWVVGYLSFLVGSLLSGAPVIAVPDGMPPAVPLMAGGLGGLVTGALTGGVVAGLVGRLARTAPRWRAAALTFAGTAVVVTVVLVQASGAMRGQDGFAGDRRVVLGLCAATVVTALAGWFLGSCWVFGRPGLGIALAALAAVVPAWATGLYFEVLSATSSFSVVPDTRWALWLGVAVLAGGLVVIGVRPLGRVAWWAVALLIAWFIGPVLTAAGYIEVYLRPGAGLPGTLPEALAATWQVLGEASSPANRWLVPWVVAVVVAAVVSVVRTRREAPQPTSS
jgi:hypothetical protein